MINLTLCFDYFGTLVKVDEPFLQLKNFMKEYLIYHAYQIDIDKFYHQFVKYRAVYERGKEFLNGTEVLSRSLVKTCEKFMVDEFTHELLCFVEKLFSDAPAYEGSLDVIQSLRTKYTVGIISNTDNDIINKSIKKQGFELDFLITSQDAGSNKPDAGIFHYAMKLLHKDANELCMIGDSLTADICGAGWLGISTVWINRNKEMPKEGSCMPDYIIYDLAEITTLLPSDI